MRALSAVLATLVLVSAPASAQQFGPAAPSPGAPQPAGVPRPDYHIPPRQSFAELPAPHNSILRQRPWHESFVPESQPGFRNPGGVGRVAEYYPAGDKFQNTFARSSANARIGLGGVPDRNEQLQAQRVGTGYYNMLMTHIDRYGSPYMGFGMGFGWGW